MPSSILLLCYALLFNPDANFRKVTLELSAGGQKPAVEPAAKKAPTESAAKKAPAAATEQTA